MTCIADEITISGDLEIPNTYATNNEYLVNVYDNGYVRTALYIATPIRTDV
jgi:hypothetical protein